jgi:hypothetical protein
VAYFKSQTKISPTESWEIHHKLQDTKVSPKFQVLANRILFTSQKTWDLFVNDYLTCNDLLTYKADICGPQRFRVPQVEYRVS